MKWEKKRIRDRKGIGGEPSPSPGPEYNSIWWPEPRREKRRAAVGKGRGGVDLMMWCYGPSPSKGGLWKALLITTCDETGRTKTAGQKITAWELWVNLKYNKRAHTPRLHLLLPPRSIHKHTHTESETNVDAHLCLLWQKLQVACTRNVCERNSLAHSQHTHSHRHQLTADQLSKRLYLVCVCVCADISVALYNNNKMKTALSASSHSYKPNKAGLLSEMTITPRVAFGSHW